MDNQNEGGRQEDRVEEQNVPNGASASNEDESDSLPELDDVVNVVVAGEDIKLDIIELEDDQIADEFNIGDGDPLVGQSMAERMQTIRETKDIQQMTFLTLAHCPGHRIVGLTNEFVSLVELNLTDCELTTLEGFPELPNLLALSLKLNSITGELHLLKKSPLLRLLDISRNPISDFNELLPLASFEHLRYLDIHGIFVDDIAMRRLEVFNAIPQLLYLDNLDKEMEDIPKEIMERDFTFI